MSKTLEKGNQKIQEICDKLRKETLEPAQQQAQEIIENAHQKAEEILSSAEKQSQQLIQEARKQIAKEDEVFRTSLNQSVRQTVEALRQQIAEHLFAPALAEKIDRFSTDPELVKQLIFSLAEAVQKEGLDADLLVEVGNKCKADTIVHSIGKEVQDRLRIKEMTVGSFHGGARIRIVGKNYTIDMTNATLIDLFAQFCRKDVREMLFALKKTEAGTHSHEK